MLIQGEHYNFTVIRVLERGAVGTIEGETRTGFVHISCISNSFVQNVSDYIKVGETYDAVCQDADKFGLSLKHLNLQKIESAEITKKPDTRRPEYHQAKNPYTYTKSTTPKSTTPTSIDEMIARADASLKDKQKHKSVPQTRQRKWHRQNNSDVD